MKRGGETNDSEPERVRETERVSEAGEWVCTAEPQAHCSTLQCPAPPLCSLLTIRHHALKSTPPPAAAAEELQHGGLPADDPHRELLSPPMCSADIRCLEEGCECGAPPTCACQSTAKMKKKKKRGSRQVMLPSGLCKRVTLSQTFAANKDAHSTCTV